MLWWPLRILAYSPHPNAVPTKWLPISIILRCQVDTLLTGVSFPGTSSKDFGGVPGMERSRAH